MQTSYNGYSDEELVRMAQQGNETAEEFLIKKYKDVVKGKAHLYFIMGADAEDVVQEGMIGIFKAIRSYNADRNTTFQTFAELCINRQIITAINQAKRMKHAPLNSSVSLNKPLNSDEYEQTLGEVLLPDCDNNPETMLIIKEIMDYISTDGSKLFSDMEYQVWNEYVQGKGYKIIAEELGKSPKTIDNAIQRIKKKIAVYIGS